MTPRALSASLRTPGQLIHDARTFAGFSQRDLAKRAGTQQSAISRLEGGQGEPSLRTLRKIAAACGCMLRLEFEDNAMGPNDQETSIMNTWKITSADDDDLGVYAARSPLGALYAMAREAGCDGREMTWTTSSEDFGRGGWDLLIREVVDGEVLP